MKPIFRTIALLAGLLALCAFGADKKKYHLLYTGESEGAYGPCG